MAFSTNDMQSTKGDDALVILCALTHFLLKKLILFIFGHVFDVLLNGLFLVGAFIFVVLWHSADIADLLGMFAQNRIEVASRVAAEQNVSTPTSHIGGDGDGSTATSLCHNLGLTLMVFG